MKSLKNNLVMKFQLVIVDVWSILGPRCNKQSATWPLNS